jgi:hypothetical protein
MQQVTLLRASLDKAQEKEEKDTTANVAAFSGYPLRDLQRAAGKLYHLSLRPLLDRCKDPTFQP